MALAILKTGLKSNGWKCRYEDWIKRAPIPPSDFYDNTKGQNGQNNDWFDYFDVSGWNIYFKVEIYALLNGEQVKYQNLKQFTVSDYDSNTTITTELKYYRDNNGVKGAQLTGGVDPETSKQYGLIIDNEKVFLDIIYTSNVPVWVDQATLDLETYGVNRIEVDKDQGGQINLRQLSSIWASENDNPMIGIPGETLAKVVFISTTQIVVETMIDSDKLPLANKYEISGRIGCQ
jgi:hypothetical protein